MYKKNGWNVYQDNGEKISNNAKLLLKQEWTEKNIPKMSKEEIKYDIEPLYELLILKDSEKFQDKYNNVFEIETRGLRDPEHCYFRAKDIEKAFNIKNLTTTITNTQNQYEINKHYKTFILHARTIDSSSSNKNKQVLYLTYLGLSKVLFCSRTGTADRFVT